MFCSRQRREGHVFLPKELLLGRTTELLGVPIDDLDPFLVDMAIQKKIVIRKDGDRDCVYSASLLYGNEYGADARRSEYYR